MASFAKLAMQLYIPKITRNSSTCRVYFVLSLCIKRSINWLSSKFLYNAVHKAKFSCPSCHNMLRYTTSIVHNWLRTLLLCLSEGFTLMCIYIYIYIYIIYIYINIILVSDSDLFKFLLIHSLFLFYFAELKFPVQCTDDSWAVGSKVIVKRSFRDKINAIPSYSLRNIVRSIMFS